MIITNLNAELEDQVWGIFRLLLKKIKGENSKNLLVTRYFKRKKIKAHDFLIQIRVIIPTIRKNVSFS